MTLGLTASTLELVDFGIAPKRVDVHELGHVYRVTMH